MSLKPGIGANAMKDMGESMTRTKWGAKAMNDYGDVPLEIKYDNKRSMPLGRYLRKKLRQEVGFPDETPEKAIMAYKEKMQALRTDHGETAFKAGSFLQHDKMTRNENRKPLKQRKL